MERQHVGFNQDWVYSRDCDWGQRVEDKGDENI